MTNNQALINVVINKYFRALKTALIVVDCQNEYLDVTRLSKRNLNQQYKHEEKLDKLNEFIDVARKSGVKIIWTRMSVNRVTSPKPIKVKIDLHISDSLFELTNSVPGENSYEFYAPFTPKSRDKVIDKNHYDAFSNPLLGKYLKDQDIEAVVLAGGFASRCVLGTAYGANNHDMHVAFLEDLVFSPKNFEDEIPSVIKIINGILGYVMESGDLLDVWRN